jgi:putative inorganic carbon (hco3(-)) transporter
MRAFALLVLTLAYIPSIFIQPFCGVLLWTWFSIMNPHRLVWGFASELPFAQVTAILTLVVLVLSREPKVPPRSLVTLSFVAMMVIYSFATLFALSPLAVPIWDRVMKELLFSLITLTLLTTKERIHALVWVIVLSLGYFGLKGGVFTIWTGGNYLVYGPPHSYISDNNHLAVALIMALPLMNYLRLQSKVWFMSVGMTVLMILSSTAAIFTFSRGGFLALGATGALLWWRSRHKLLLATLALIGGVLLINYAPDKLSDRFKTIEAYEQDGSALARLEIWRAALRIAENRPLLGGGFRVTHDAAALQQHAPGTRTRAIHNSHLEVLTENGVFALLFHLILLGATWFNCRHVMRAARRRGDLLWAKDLAAMVQTSLVAYVVGGAFLSLGYYDGWYCLPIIATGLRLWVDKSASKPVDATTRATSPAATKLVISSGLR